MIGFEQDTVYPEESYAVCGTLILKSFSACFISLSNSEPINRAMKQVPTGKMGLPTYAGKKCYFFKQLSKQWAYSFPSKTCKLLRAVEWQIVGGNDWPTSLTVYNTLREITRV